MAIQTLNVLHNPGTSGRIPFVVDADSIPNKYYAAVQNWVLCFFTKRGTRLLDPGYGTYFIEQLNSGNIRTGADALLAFSQASSSCLQYCFRDDDELRVVDSFLTDYSVFTDDTDKRLSLYVAFKFSDGNATRTMVEV